MTIENIIQKIQELKTQRKTKSTLESLTKRRKELFKLVEKKRVAKKPFGNTQLAIRIKAQNEINLLEKNWEKLLVILVERAVNGKLIASNADVVRWLEVNLTLAQDLISQLRNRKKITTYFDPSKKERTITIL